MKKDCLDIGTIQAFLDGELASDLVENAANHLALCDDCTMLLGNAEEETAIAFSALDAELNTLVPTQRLWAKINNEIEKEKKSFWQTIYAFFKNPTITAFASLLIVFGLFMAYLNSQTAENNNLSAENTKPSENIIKISQTDKKVEDLGEKDSSEAKKDVRVNLTRENNKSDFRIVKAVVNENRETRITPKPNNDVVNPQPAVYQYLPGEESYIKTISSLENSVNSRKNEILKPSEQVTFEQNLAVVNNAIKTMRQEVKKNPRNNAAKQILMASYQNKVDLLNSVTEKNELMASMR